MEKTAHSVWVMVLIGLSLYPPTILLDWILYPDQIASLAIVRFGTTGILALYGVAFYIANRKGRAVPHAHHWAWGIVVIVSISLDAMNLVTGGPESHYYAAVPLLLVGVLVAMPWGLRRMGVPLTFIVVQYDVVMLLFDQVFDGVLFLRANYFMVATIFIGLFWTYFGQRLRIGEFILRKQVEEEKARSESLLLNILPEEVANELKAHGRVQARNIDSCSILFTDFVGFTRVAGRVPADELVHALDEAFSRFDTIVARYGLEKLKTIGDSYMCAGGVLGEQPDHLVRCALAALEMFNAIEDETLISADKNPWRMRIGLHQGPVVAGVIGKKKFAFDLWGDTVNTASRLEATGQPRSINLSTTVYKQLEEFFEGVDRGFVPVKGKGPMGMTRLTRLRPEFSDHLAGLIPNERLTGKMEAWGAGRPIPQASIEMPAMDYSGDASDKEELAALRSMSELSVEDREIMMGLAKPVSYTAGQALIEQGQSLSVLFFILTGRVGVRISRNSISIQVGILGPGEIVGELSFVSWEPAAASVAALEDVEVLKFDLDWADMLTEQHPQTAVRLYRSLSLVLSQRVREANARLFSWKGGDDATREEGSLRHRISSLVIPNEFKEAVENFRTRMQALDRQVRPGDPGIQTEVDKVCDTLIETAARHALTDKGPNPTFDPGICAYTLRETYTFFMRSAVMERIHAKPLGAGLDYLSEEAVYLNKPGGHEPLGPAVDAWFLNQQLAVAIRQCKKKSAEVLVRMYEAHAKEGQGEFRVTILCCGAASELFSTLDKLDRPRDIAATCYDGELGALAALGQRAVQEEMGDQFTFVCETALDGGIGQPRINLRPQHLICLPVVTETCSTTDLVSLLDEVLENLEPGGVFTMGVLNIPRIWRFVAEALLEWRIKSWASEEMRQIVAQSAFSTEIITMTTDTEGHWTVVTLQRREP